MKVKIQKVFISDKKKDGTPFKDKNGKPFWKVGIQTDRTGTDWLSALAFRKEDRVMGLEEGQEVEIVVTENNGYKNFELPSRLDLLEALVNSLVVEVNTLKSKVGVTSVGTKVPDFSEGPAEIMPEEEDLPF